jgi:hypothetical protein
MFKLTTKGGEVIKKVKGMSSIEEAISYFAGIKRLSELDLLKIYKVTNN